MAEFLQRALMTVAFQLHQTQVVLKTRLIPYVAGDSEHDSMPTSVS
jgi:hypothetical protein